MIAGRRQRRRLASEMNIAAKGRHAVSGTGAVHPPPLPELATVSGRPGNVRLGLFALLMLVPLALIGAL